MRKTLTKEHKRKIGEAGKGKVCSKETRKKIGDANRGEKNGMWGKTITDENRRKKSEAWSGSKNPRYGLHLFGENHPKWEGGKVKINCKQCGKEKLVKLYVTKTGWNIFCSSRCSMIYNLRYKKKKETDIELLMKEELIKRNIEFVPQKPLLNITVVDFFIQPNIVIYCDGDYWHSREGIKEKDEKQTRILSSNGYQVYRFVGTEIKKSVEKCVDKILLESKN